MEIRLKTQDVGGVLRAEIFLLFYITGTSWNMSHACAPLTDMARHTTTWLSMKLVRAGYHTSCEMTPPPFQTSHGS